MQMQQVAGILSGQSHELAMMIFSQKKGMLETLTRQLTGSASEAAKGSAKSIAQFWLDACQDRKVCARLQAEDLPIALYNLMKEKDAKEAQERAAKRVDARERALARRRALLLTKDPARPGSGVERHGLRHQQPGGSRGSRG